MAPSLAFEAMQFARYAHANQVRKYTGNPYSDHLAEVAGIVATVPEAASLDDQRPVTTDEMISVAWLHDCIEDQGVDQLVLLRLFGENVRFGVVLLSDFETGNRAQRKAASCERLAQAPAWVQTIKCADLISNTASIVKHDPKFAQVYLQEKRALLQAMDKSHPGLRDLAFALI